jgi:hypothetical protein
VWEKYIDIIVKEKEINLKRVRTRGQIFGEYVQSPRVFMYNNVNAAFGCAEAGRPTGITGKTTGNERLGFTADEFAENRKSRSLF